MQVWILMLVGAPISAAAAAQDPEGPRSEAAPALSTRVYLAMVTAHVRDPSSGAQWNSLVGVSARGFYGATFLNSYGDRGFAGGIQRSLTTGSNSTTRTGLGYRVGVVTGYDERFLAIASSLPALPFAQLLASLDHRNVGVELAYAGLVASVLMSWRF